MASDTDGWHGASASVWIAVLVIIVGSIMAGLALIAWVWPVFWVGVGLMVVATIGAAFLGIMDSVDEIHLPKVAELEASQPTS